MRSSKNVKIINFTLSVTQGTIMGGPRLKEAYWNSGHRCAVCRQAKRCERKVVELSAKNDVSAAAQLNHNAAKRKTLKFLSCANSANVKNSSSISNCNTFQLNGIFLQF